MRRALLSLWWLGLVLWVMPATAATGRVVKVLPEYLDLKGRTSLSPSLYERDAYQAALRDHPERRSGMRFYVQWKIKGAAWEQLTVQLELRGTAKGDLPTQLVLAQRAENTGGSFSHWMNINVTGENYRKIGSVTAWRVTFWEGKTLLGEEHSFLW